VIIPTLNEAKNLPLVLPYVPTHIVDEVLLVDGRSEDATVEIARQLLPSIRIILEPNPGKGAALRRGFQEATGDILVVLDADGSHDPREIPRFVQALLEGADFAKGSRFAPAGGTTDMPRLRKSGNWGLTKLVNLLFSQSFTDLCYGYHAFWRRCLDYMDLDVADGFEIDTVLYLQAVRKKLKVVDVPSFEGLRFYGHGKLQTFPDGFRVLRTILREWKAGLGTKAPEPQVGFRSNTLRSPTMRQAIPVTGSGPVSMIEPSDSTDTTARKSCSLEEFFSAILKQSPQEELEPLLSAVLLEVMERMGASSGTLVIHDPEGNYQNGFKVFGRNAEKVSIDDLNDLLKEGISGWVIRNRQPVLIKNTAQDPRWLSQPWEENETAGRSAVAVPFFRDEKLIGQFILARPMDRGFTEKELFSIPSMRLFL
jgi:GAF domain-containing protein